MTPRKFSIANIMRRGDTANEDETESESADEDVTESDESVMDKKNRRLMPFFKFSYKRLPKKFLKVSFLSINGATFLTGITALIISIWMLADGKLMSRLMGQRLFVTILLFIGLLSSTVAFLGILAIVKKKKKFLVIYMICHVVSLTIIFISAVMSFSFFDHVMRKVREDMYSSIVNYHSLDWVTEAWDNTHRYLQCCGIKSLKDWGDYNMNIPQSCCSTSIDKCLKMTEEVAYKAGCLKSTLLLLKSHAHTIAVSALILAITLVIGVILAYGIRKRLKLVRSASSAE